MTPPVGAVVNGVGRSRRRFACSRRAVRGDQVDVGCGREPRWNPFVLELLAVVLGHSTLKLAGAAFPCQDDSRARSLHPFHRQRRVAGSTNSFPHLPVRFGRKATASGSLDTTHTSRNSGHNRVWERRNMPPAAWVFGRRRWLATTHFRLCEAVRQRRQCCGKATQGLFVPAPVTSAYAPTCRLVPARATIAGRIIGGTEKLDKIGVWPAKHAEYAKGRQAREATVVARSGDRATTRLVVDADFPA